MADRKAELAAKKEKLRQIREEKVGVHDFTGAPVAFKTWCGHQYIGWA